MNEDPSITQMLKIHMPIGAWLPRVVREKLTPALVGSVITTIFMGVAYLLNSPQKDIHRLQESMAELKQSLDQAVTLLHKEDTQQAVMSSQIGDLTEKADRNEGRWDRLADIAETPPHARRRPK